MPEPHNPLLEMIFMRNLIHSSKRLAIAVLMIVVLLTAIPFTNAQTGATQLNSMAVELWPDYDRPAMLVLLTGVLPSGTTLPADVTIPLTPGAEIHAVASFNEAGALLSNVNYSVENGRLRLTTPSTSFRVEYYAPYESDGDEYRFTFDWLSDLSIDEMAFVAQQPAAASDFRTTPAAISSAANRGDGLNYHTLPSRPVGAGEPISVEIAYSADAPVLSAPSQTLPDVSAPVSDAASSETTASGGGFNPLWLLAIAGGLALMGGAWYMGQRQGRSASRTRKPRPARPPHEEKPKTPKATSNPANKKAAVQYCHNCGTPAQAGDGFCRNCGAQLKAD